MYAELKRTFNNDSRHKLIVRAINELFGLEVRVALIQKVLMCSSYPQTDEPNYCHKLENLKLA